MRDQRQQSQRDFDRQSGLLFMIIVVAVPAIWLFGVVKDAVAATPVVPAVPVEVDINTVAKLSGLKVGKIVPFIVKVTAANKLNKLQVGFPGSGAILAPSRPLMRLKGADPIWNVGPLAKGKSKTLTFNVKVENPPSEEVSGDLAPWCIVAISAPSLLKGPPVWIKTETLCLTIKI